MNVLSKKQSLNNLNCIFRNTPSSIRRRNVQNLKSSNQYYQYNNRKDFFVPLTSSHRSIHILNKGNDDGNDDKHQFKFQMNHYQNPIMMTNSYPFFNTSSYSISSLDYIQHIPIHHNTNTTLRFFSTQSNSTTTPPSTTNQSSSTSPPTKPPLFKMIRKYGFTFLGSYFILWSTTLSSFYIGLDNGILDPMTLTQINLPWHHGDDATLQDAQDKQEFESAVDYVAFQMEQYSWTKEYADYVKGNPRVSNLALALIATKMTEPVRIGVILAILPKISRMLGNGGSNSSSSDNNRKDDGVDGENKHEKEEKAVGVVDQKNSVKTNNNDEDTIKKQ